MIYLLIQCLLFRPTFPSPLISRSLKLALPAHDVHDVEDALRASLPPLRARLREVVPSLGKRSVQTRPRKTLEQSDESASSRARRVRLDLSSQRPQLLLVEYAKDGLHVMILSLAERSSPVATSLTLDERPRGPRDLLDLLGLVGPTGLLGLVGPVRLFSGLVGPRSLSGLVISEDLFRFVKTVRVAKAIEVSIRTPGYIYGGSVHSTLHDTKRKKLRRG